MFRSERMRRTGARSTASGTSSHMQSWAGCITGTHESSFWKRQEAHLSRILRAYAGYYNDIRTHRSLDKDAPVSRPVQRAGIISSRPILGGLHHHYVRVRFSAHTMDKNARFDIIKR